MTVAQLVEEIDSQLDNLKDEEAKLEAARAALTGHKKPGRPRNS